jgi:hypothetical protein
MKRCTSFAILAIFWASSVFALYDPKPDEALAAAQGEWQGLLTYRDYSKPERLVALSTRLFVALSAPNELVLHYVFDDGPSKTVFSYERMTFDFANNQVTWWSGTTEKSVSVHRITSNSAEGDVRRLTLEKRDGEKIDRHTLELSPRKFRLAKDEVSFVGVSSFRNKYEFSRPGA